MGIAKSHGQEVLRIVNETLVDAYTLLTTLQYSTKSTDLERDLIYIEKRFENEGITFLTQTLPRLGEWFDQITWGQEVQRVVGFEPYDGLHPCFLRPFWAFAQDAACKISHSATEALLIRTIRTILHGLKKLDVPCAQHLVDDRLANFLQIEEDLADLVIIPDPVIHRAQLLLEDFCNGYTPAIKRPHHGPGAVADGARHKEKWEFSDFFSSVHEEWNLWEHLYPVRSVIETATIPRRSYQIQLAAKARYIRERGMKPFPIARLLLVPKDSRGPRIISCEPKELMYLQQGVSDHLMEYIEGHRYTRGHVNFERQDINANLALISSLKRDFSTIDLSDASDRVSCQLIKLLFPERISRKWLALRSHATKLPDGRDVMLSKFAPMGSALCFPVESLVFWAICVGCVWERTHDLSVALTSCYVYGDDIIVSDEHSGPVMNALERCGLSVNRRKSFSGKIRFRESCGIEAFNGHDVTPFRIKKMPARRPSDGTSLVAWVKYAENTADLLPNRSTAILKSVEKLVGPIPRVTCSQAFLSIVVSHGAWDLSRFKSKWDASRCQIKVYAWSVKTRPFTNYPSDWSRLQRGLIESFADRDPELVVDRQSTLIRRKFCFFRG
jgi:hypothetical protein